jgi:hypothetical protein
MHCVEVQDQPISPRQAKRMAIVRKHEADISGQVQAVRSRVTAVAEALKKEDGQTQDHDTRPGLVTISLEGSHILGQAQPIKVGTETVLEATLKFDPTSGDVAHMQALTYGSEGTLVNYHYTPGMYSVDVRGKTSSMDRHQTLIESAGQPTQLTDKGWRPGVRDLGWRGFLLGAGVAAAVAAIPLGIVSYFSTNPLWTIGIAAGAVGLFGAMAAEHPMGFVVGGGGVGALAAAGVYGGLWGLAGVAVAGGIAGGLLDGTSEGRVQKPPFVP